MTRATTNPPTATSPTDAAALTPNSPTPRRIELLGIPLDALTAREAIDHIASSLARGEGGWTLTPNLEILRLLTTDRRYADICRGATLRLADGMPLLLASRLRRTPLPERVAGSDLIWSLTARMADEGRSVFFLGGNPGVAEEAARVLRSRSPSLRVAGTECPPFGFENDQAYVPALVERLRLTAPDLCFAAMSSFKQDQLIASLRPHFPRTWFVGVGISFSFVTGHVQRAPRWLQRLGLEWLHRLVQEPRRLAKRYLLHGLPFAARLLAVSAMQGLTRGGHRDVS
ncbi:MAG: WecB/TagA/CpsF family glycosyltransferase [Phycisphaerales bacterium]